MTADRPRLAISAPTDTALRSGGHPKIVAVASGKGGVGKTLLSATLAQAIARMGRRALLFDGDLGMANIDIQLGLMPRRDLAMALDRGASIKSAAHRYDIGGFDVIVGRSGSGSLASLSTPRLNEIGQELIDVTEAYDRVLIDLGAGVDRTVRQLAGFAGTILVVTTDEPTALTDAYAFIKVMATAKPDTLVRVIVNLASSLAEGERTYSTLRKACENFLGFAPPLLGVVRRDKAVREAIRHQTPLLLRAPQCEAALDIQLLADRLFADSLQPSGTT